MNAHVDEMNDPAFDPLLRGAWRKFREYAGRFILVLACLDHAADLTVDADLLPRVEVRHVESRLETGRLL